MKLSTRIHTLNNSHSEQTLKINKMFLLHLKRGKIDYSSGIKLYLDTYRWKGLLNIKL